MPTKFKATNQGTLTHEKTNSNPLELGQKQACTLSGVPHNLRDTQFKPETKDGGSEMSPI